MSSKYDKIIKNFVQTIRESDKRGTSPYDTTAEVLRVDGDTAWVHIAGGVDETPVKKTIDCKPGDVVQLRVGGGRAWITGNATAPPTDDTKAKEADKNAKTANKNAIRAIKTVEAEADGRKLLIRQVADGIEIGFENSGYKALINGEGSFDVITASGETVATFSEESTMRSVRTETWDVHGIESEVEVEAWQQLTPDGTQFYKREHSIDEDFYYDQSQSTIIDAYGIKPQGSGAIFTLGANVRAPNETKLWHMKTGSSSYMIEGAWFGAGYITSSRTKVNFTIPLAVPVVEGASVSCYTMDATMRQGGNYILGDGDSTEDVDPSYVTVTTCPSGLNISINFPSALSGATNNDAVGIVCNYYISVGAVS